MTMLKSVLSKIIVLVIILVAVSAVIVATMRVDFSSAVDKAAQGHTFFELFVIAGGPIVWFILLPMSLVMVYLVAEYSLTIRRKKLLPNDIGTRIVEMSRQSGTGLLEARIGESKDFVSIAVTRAITKGGGDWFRMRNLLFESLQEQALRLVRRIEWINLIGNVSPMVGLFGTVVGMIQIFNTIVTAGGQPQPAQLAGGISVALVTTFWGLLIAIPALAVHGVFQNRIETLLSDAITEAENIMPQIKLNLEKQTEQLKQEQPIVEIGPKPAGTISQSVPLRR